MTKPGVEAGNLAVVFLALSQSNFLLLGREHFPRAPESSFRLRGSWGQGTGFASQIVSWPPGFPDGCWTDAAEWATRAVQAARAERRAPVHSSGLLGNWR